MDYYVAMETLLTTGEAAKILGVSHSTVRGYIRRGVLPVARRVTNRLLLVDRTEVERIKANPPQVGRPRKERQP